MARRLGGLDGGAPEMREKAGRPRGERRAEGEQGVGEGSQEEEDGRWETRGRGGPGVQMG